MQKAEQNVNEQQTQEERLK